MNYLYDVSIVVLSFNRADVIEIHIKQLAKIANEYGCELIVVDNNSQDGSSDILKRISQEEKIIKLILNNENSGVSEGRNIGWSASTRRYILSIDNDIRISTEDILKAVDCLNENERIGLVSPNIVDVSTGVVLNGDAKNAFDAGEFYEACFLIPRAVIREVGAFDPNLRVAGEGLDFSLRLRRAGYRIRRIPAAQAIHVDRLRVGSVIAQRRRDWLWSFCYVYWKNMTVIPAMWHSARILVAHARSGARLFGASFVLSLPKWAVAGARAGRAARRER